MENLIFMEILWNLWEFQQIVIGFGGQDVSSVG